MATQKPVEAPARENPARRAGPPGNSLRTRGASELTHAVRHAIRQVSILRSREEQALSYDEEELFNELLLRLGSDPRQIVLRMVAGICSSHSLARLIQLGARVDAPEGASGPLHAAAFRAREDHIRILLAADADPDRKDEKGRSPLHFAALVKHPEGIQLIAAAGARVNARDAAGRTPLHNAGASDYGFRRNFSRNRLSETIRVLLREGARLSLKDAQGRTAWQTAAFEESRDELLAHLAARRLTAARSSAPAGVAAQDNYHAY